MPIKLTLLLWIWVSSPSTTAHKQATWELELGKKVTLPTLNMGNAQEAAPVCARAEATSTGKNSYLVTVELGSVAEKSAEHISPHIKAQTMCLMRSSLTLSCRDGLCTAPTTPTLFSQAQPPGPGWVIQKPTDPVHVTLKSVQLKSNQKN